MYHQIDNPTITRSAGERGKRSGFQKWLTPKGWRFWIILIAVLVVLSYIYRFLNQPVRQKQQTQRYDSSSDDHSDIIRPIIPPPMQHHSEDYGVRAPVGASKFTARMQISNGLASNPDPIGVVEMEFYRDWAPNGFE